MNIKVKFYGMQLVFIAILAPIEYLTYKLFVESGYAWLLFILCPIVFLGFLLVWFHYISSLKCKACGKQYGICANFLPKNCVNCGVSAYSA